MGLWEKIGHGFREIWDELKQGEFPPEQDIPASRVEGDGGTGEVPWEAPWSLSSDPFDPARTLSDEEGAELKARLAEALKKRQPVVYQTPAFAPRRVYGGKGTIYRTGHLDIEVDKHGTVTAVWFRCLNLPFQVFTRPDSAHINPEGVAIEEITYVELPSEESSQ